MIREKIKMLRLSEPLWLLNLVFLIFHSLTSFSSVQALCVPEELNALLNLNCSDWSSFNMSADCCSWPGVGCDRETGRMVSFDPSRCFPDGKITSKSSLFSLSNLQFLAISSYDGSKIEMDSDAFDALARNFTRLQQLVLSEINMSSVPPASLLNLASSLKFLKIVSCQLTGEFSHNSFHLPNLVFLLLNQNSLQGPIPPWICALPNLHMLYLRDNHFTGKICRFQSSSMDWLDLSNNELEGAVPRTLFQIKELFVMNLSSNHLRGNVELQELSKLKGLFDLDLSHNNLSLTNNCENCTLQNLNQLRMSSCNLTEFPHFLRSSKYLERLDLSNNQIQGIVPKWLQEMERLEFLDLRSNFFFGPLPNFPPSLKYPFASKNQLSGEIPSSICNSTSLAVLDLSYNNLSGRIPPCIGNAKNLVVIDLRSNNLSGRIPESLFEKSNSLESLNLNGNQLDGKLPRSLLNCMKLEILDVGNNQFNDTFPGWLDALPQLQVLVLRGNKFHGSIRNSNPLQRKHIFSFQKLRILDLSHNDFTGALPTKYFDNFKAMKIEKLLVNLSYMGDNSDYSYTYQESVRVTMKGVELELERIQTIFTTIDLSSNDFTGAIPELLGNLKSLKGLNLSHNMLTGILPPSLGNLSNIEWLDLSSNELVGKIPAELADLQWLSNLNLSYNHLEGPIPRGPQFNTFHNESFEGNLNLCGFPLSKSCGRDTKLPLEPSLEHDDDVTNWFSWRIVMMGFAGGLVIGVSIGYMLLYSNGKLHWLSATILEEIEYRKAIRPKRRNFRRSVRK